MNAKQDDNLAPEASGSPIDARVTRVERNASGQLVVHLTGGETPVTDVKLTRYFPWSLPDAYVSVRTNQDREVAVLTDLDELDPDSRNTLESELHDKVFNPKLLRILDYRNEFGISYIKAETDRGEVTFQFRGRHDIRLLSPTRALIRDVDSNTYELPDFNRLDPTSQRYLQRYF